MPFDSPMSAVIALGRRDIIPISDTQAIDNPGGTKAIGQFSFNPSLYGDQAGFYFQALMWVSKGTITGSVQLYNVSDGEAVAGALLQSSSTTPSQQSSGALTVGPAAGNLKDSTKIYEVRISVTGSDASDILSVGSVRLLVT